MLPLIRYRTFRHVSDSFVFVSNEKKGHGSFTYLVPPEQFIKHHERRILRKGNRPRCSLQNAFNNLLRVRAMSWVDLPFYLFADLMCFHSASAKCTPADIGSGEFWEVIKAFTLEAFWKFHFFEFQKNAIKILRFNPCTILFKMRNFKISSCK